VFGRRAGIAAAEYVKTCKANGRLTLEHLQTYVGMLDEAGVETQRRAPVLLPDYRGKAVLARMIDVL
jgi:hypothetical protein